MGYLPDNAFQVRLTARARAVLAGHDAVRWIGPYKAGYKVHPRLWPGSGEDWAEVTVNLFADASLDAVRAALAARVPGAALPADLGPHLTQAALRRAPGAPRRVRGRGGPGLGRGPHRALLSGRSPTTTTPSAPSSPTSRRTSSAPLCTTCSIFNHGLTGTGQIAAVADSGNDSDMCFFRYDGAIGSVTDAQSPVPPGTGVIDPTHKMIAYYVQPGATPYDDAAFSFHGTHTSGTVTGDNYVNLSGPLAPGIDVGDGMAPNAKLVFQDVSSQTVFGAGLGDSFNMFLQASNAGARVHSNSYGAPTGGAYSGDDSIADRFLFDHEEMAIFISAGNDGPGANTIGSPGNAKNVVTVGALGHGNSTTIASFSSRGPTDDGRIKPDIMAPGSATRSALGDASHTSDNCGTQALSGTSMSCPTTAGGAVLLRQYFEDGYYPTGTADPADALSARAPLVKAALLNGTLPLPAGGPFGGFNFGWGRIFLDNNAFFTGDGRELRVWNVANTDGLQTAGSVVHQVTVAAGQEFRAALVWSDAEGSPGAGAILVNNLNLTVSDGTNTYLGQRVRRRRRVHPRRDRGRHQQRGAGPPGRAGGGHLHDHHRRPRRARQRPRGHGPAGLRARGLLRRLRHRGHHGAHGPRGRRPSTHGRGPDLDQRPGIDGHPGLPGRGRLLGPRQGLPVHRIDLGDRPHRQPRPGRRHLRLQAAGRGRLRRGAALELREHHAHRHLRRGADLRRDRVRRGRVPHGHGLQRARDLERGRLQLPQRA